MSDPYNLHHFLDAQEVVYDTVLDELRAGRKSSHWIWFILRRSSVWPRFARPAGGLVMNRHEQCGLIKDFDGKPDQSTLHILAQQSL
ncbi:DUF1810 family protein [Candidatus Nitrospira nitrificans]|uniref:Calpastatin n=1 Tax=Candidatus Nitrospira nitrificans TaxID=1742973 RepID=A0A0S4LCR3_9BACT|nr:DUF1810 family protein [Candidatus Nitrospira nitrificans]CUS35285.1 hypothetical protein COMA2_20187 [Candidatus Nitrospira nitrificans]